MIGDEVKLHHFTRYNHGGHLIWWFVSTYSVKSQIIFVLLIQSFVLFYPSFRCVSEMAKFILVFTRLSASDTMARAGRYSLSNNCPLKGANPQFQLLVRIHHLTR